MRQTIRGYVLAFAVLSAVSAPAFAQPKNGSKGESFFTRLKDAIVRIYDDSKLSFPPG